MFNIRVSFHRRACQHGNTKIIEYMYVTLYSTFHSLSPLLSSLLTSSPLVSFPFLLVSSSLVSSALFSSHVFSPLFTHIVSSFLLFSPLLSSPLSSPLLLSSFHLSSLLSFLSSNLLFSPPFFPSVYLRFCENIVLLYMPSQHTNIPLTMAFIKNLIYHFD